MTGKKGFEIQFNWMFILIAGAAILLFFTTLVIKQKDISSASLRSTTLKSVEAIIAGSSVSKETTNLLEMPDIGIEVECGRVSIEGISKQYQNLILFAPSLIKGSQFISQTSDFSNPYKATNLLYMTSSNVRYILVGNTELAKEINKSLPAYLKKEFYPVLPQLKGANNYKVKFIFFETIGDLPKFTESISNKDVAAIKIEGTQEKGIIYFYQRNSNSWELKGTSAYIGRQSLIGAVYSDSLKSYECSMENTFLRLNLVTQIYLGRTNELIQIGQSADYGQDCNFIYTDALIHLNSISAASSRFNKENIDELAASAKLLAENNKRAQLYSCPLIY